MISARPLSIILFIFALGCFGQHHHPHHFINNHLENGDSITLQIQIFQHDSKLSENNVTLVYTLDQPQIKMPIDVPVSSDMDNLTVVVHLLSQKIYNRKVYSSSRNLTRYSKYRNTQSNDSLDFDQIGMQMGVNQKGDQHTKYGIHIADRFSILVLHHQTELPYDKMYFNFFNIKTYNKQYVLAADISQMQIPFKNYIYVPEINNNTHTIQFSIKVFKFTYFQMLYGLTNVQLMQKNTPMLGQIYTEEVIDSIKYFLFENNLYLILLYFILSLTQTFMQIFAFKNEIKIWKDIKNKPGLSIKVLYQKFVCEIVILCYLIIHDSNKLYIFFQFLDMVLTLWKVKKAFTLSIGRQNRFFISFKYQKWYSQKVEKVDEQANKFSYKLLALFSIIFSIWKLYSLRNKLYSSYLSLHQTGLGSISFKKVFVEFINIAAFYIFIFGFVMMTPQLYINYKLKSVAHMPWKTLIYRFISTIIDDVFILMIDVPTLNVMLCFRDDVIFVLYLIQRRLYPVDSNRKGLAEGQIRVQGNQAIASEQSKKQK